MSATPGHALPVRIDSLSKHYGAVVAVDRVSLDVAAGEFLTLLGPSGSGKTTILRMVAGLEYADAGAIYFGEENATDIPVRERGVGFVFQHYALFPHMTVGDNIAFGMKVSRVKRTPQAIEARVKELLDLVQLGGLKDRFPGQISGGRKTRTMTRTMVARNATETNSGDSTTSGGA